eukprot:MONOS_14437.1-p1 / transcript=MONOS_14437.1 / gene=MONOS_14437 / organism=Monocercomonoides_exilis_PA203 / gene_product=unspecified product / transcript_product=unspecified product / location=Mono_scaffold01001:14945-20391(-) / protein_length=1570 / sequence_SO=supercontig / SO=protein_coding / is_pseudo=false
MSQKNCQKLALLEYFKNVTSCGGGGGILLHGPPQSGKKSLIINAMFELASEQTPISSPSLVISKKYDLHDFNAKNSAKFGTPSKGFSMSLSTPLRSPYRQPFTPQKLRFPIVTQIQPYSSSNDSTQKIELVQFSSGISAEPGSSLSLNLDINSEKNMEERFETPKCKPRELPNTQQMLKPEETPANNKTTPTKTDFIVMTRKMKRELEEKGSSSTDEIKTTTERVAECAAEMKIEEMAQKKRSRGRPKKIKPEEDVAEQKGEEEEKEKEEMKSKGRRGRKGKEELKALNGSIDNNEEEEEDEDDDDDVEIVEIRSDGTEVALSGSKKSKNKFSMIVSPSSMGRVVGEAQMVLRRVQVPLYMYDESSTEESDGLEEDEEDEDAGAADTDDGQNEKRGRRERKGEDGEGSGEKNEKPKKRRGRKAKGNTKQSSTNKKRGRKRKCLTNEENENETDEADKQEKDENDNENNIDTDESEEEGKSNEEEEEKEEEEEEEEEANAINEMDVNEEDDDLFIIAEDGTEMKVVNDAAKRRARQLRSQTNNNRTKRKGKNGKKRGRKRKSETGEDDEEESEYVPGEDEEEQEEGEDEAEFETDSELEHEASQEEEEIDEEEEDDDDIEPTSEESSEPEAKNRRKKAVLSRKMRKLAEKAQKREERKEFAGQLVEMLMGEGKGEEESDITEGSSTKQQRTKLNGDELFSKLLKNYSEKMNKEKGETTNKLQIEGTEISDAIHSEKEEAFSLNTTDNSASSTIKQLSQPLQSQIPPLKALLQQTDSIMTNPLFAPAPSHSSSTHTNTSNASLTQSFPSSSRQLLSVSDCPFDVVWLDGAILSGPSAAYAEIIAQLRRRQREREVERERRREMRLKELNISSGGEDTANKEDDNSQSSSSSVVSFTQKANEEPTKREYPSVLPFLCQSSTNTSQSRPSTSSDLSAMPSLSVMPRSIPHLLRLFAPRNRPLLFVLLHLDQWMALDPSQLLLYGILDFAQTFTPGAVLVGTMSEDVSSRFEQRVQSRFSGKILRGWRNGGFVDCMQHLRSQCLICLPKAWKAMWNRVKEMKRENDRRKKERLNEREKVKEEAPVALYADTNLEKNTSKEEEEEKEEDNEELKKYGPLFDLDESSINNSIIPLLERGCQCVSCLLKKKSQKKMNSQAKTSTTTTKPKAAVQIPSSSASQTLQPYRSSYFSSPSSSDVSSESASSEDKQITQSSKKSATPNYLQDLEPSFTAPSDDVAMAVDEMLTDVYSYNNSIMNLFRVAQFQQSMLNFFYASASIHLLQQIMKLSLMNCLARQSHTVSFQKDVIPTISLYSAPQFGPAARLKVPSAKFNLSDSSSSSFAFAPSLRLPPTSLPKSSSTQQYSTSLNSALLKQSSSSSSSSSSLKPDSSAPFQTSNPHSQLPPPPTRFESLSQTAIVILFCLLRLTKDTRSFDAMTPDGMKRLSDVEEIWALFDSERQRHLVQCEREEFIETFNELLDEGFITTDTSSYSSAASAQRLAAANAGSSKSALSRSSVMQMVDAKVQRKGAGLMEVDDPMHSPLKLLCNSNDELVAALPSLSQIFPPSLIGWAKAQI